MKSTFLAIILILSFLFVGCSPSSDNAELASLKATNDALTLELTVQAAVSSTQSALVTDVPEVNQPEAQAADSQPLPAAPTATSEPTAIPYIPPTIIAPQLIVSGSGLTQFTTTQFLDGYNIHLLNNTAEESVGLEIDDRIGAGDFLGKCQGCEAWARKEYQLPIGDHLAKFRGNGSFEIWSLGTAPFTLRFKMNTGTSYLYKFLVPDEREYTFTVNLVSGRVKDFQVNCNNTAYFKQDVVQSLSGSVKLLPPACLVALSQIDDGTELIITVDYAQ